MKSRALGWWTDVSPLERRTLLVGSANVAVLLMNVCCAIATARVLGPSLYGVASLIQGYPNIIYSFLDCQSSDPLIKHLTSFLSTGNSRDARSLCRVGY